MSLRSEVVGVWIDKLLKFGDTSDNYEQAWLLDATRAVLSSVGFGFDDASGFDDERIIITYKTHAFVVARDGRDHEGFAYEIKRHIDNLRAYYATYVGKCKDSVYLKALESARTQLSQILYAWSSYRASAE